MELVNEIFKLLPSTRLSGINVSQELLLQHVVLKQLQVDVLKDMSVPANQQAQVANALGSNLTKIAKLQTDLFTSERFKEIELLLIDLLNEWPKKDVEQFFEQYEARGLASAV